MVDSVLGVLQNLSQPLRVHGWLWLPASRETEIKQIQVQSQTELTWELHTARRVSSHTEAHSKVWFKYVSRFYVDHDCGGFCQGIR